MAPFFCPNKKGCGSHSLFGREQYSHCSVYFILCEIIAILFRVLRFLIICIHILFAFDLFDKSFYSERDCNAKGKIRSKRTCPECKIGSRHNRPPFYAEDDVQQITTPNRSVHYNHNDQQQNKGVPVFTFIPYPFAKIYCFIFYLMKDFHKPSALMI